MLQPLAQLTTVSATIGTAWVGGMGLALGTLLWLAGSRFSQNLVTLTAVSIGAYYGNKLPGWMHSEIDPIGTCFGGAMVLGLLGYFFYRMWVGFGLGLLLAGWTAILTWQVVSPNQHWICPPLDLATFGKALWDSLPPDVQKVIPWTISSAWLAGMMLAGFWPRVAGWMFYSILGLSLLGTAGLLIQQTSGWTHLIPATPVFEGLLGAILVGLGMIVQWWIGPRRAPIAANPVPETEETESLNEQ